MKKSALILMTVLAIGALSTVMTTDASAWYRGHAYGPSVGYSYGFGPVSVYGGSPAYSYYDYYTPNVYSYRVYRPHRYHRMHRRWAPRYRSW
jgi:hypothetical protein